MLTKSIERVLSRQVEGLLFFQIHRDYSYVSWEQAWSHFSRTGSNISFSRKWSPNHFRISFPFHCVPKTQATCLCSMTVPSFVLYSSFTLPKFSLAQPFLTGFPAGLVVKYPAANAGDSSSIPESGRSPGRENGSPLQYSCLGNPMVEQPGGL